MNPLDVAAVAVVFASGVAMLVRYRSLVRVLIGVELMASSLLAIAGFAGLRGFFSVLVALEPALAALLAACIYAAARRGFGG